MRFATCISLGLVLFAVACATSPKHGTDDPATNPDGTPVDPGKEPAAETTTIPGGDDGTAPPHALGSITLGEIRASATGDSTPVISATFLPDAKKGKACTKKVGSCEMAEAPKCMTGTVQGCASTEICAFDDKCTPKCVRACTKTCSASEECVFATNAPIEDNGMACKRKDRFDAGAIAFNGTTTALTLFPPYSIKPDGNGAPFMAKSQIRAQASGAASVGFEKFDEKFSTTTFLETDPPLASIPKSELFGTGAVNVGWVPGDDHVVVTVAGVGGAARCVAEDATGKYAIARSVIDAVKGGTTSGSGNIVISVSRERRELKKDKKLVGDAAMSTGWLEFVTTSGETHSFATCPSGYTACGETCTNLLSDTKNCGTCGNVCTSGYYCSSGVCRY